LYDADAVTKKNLTPSALFASSVGKNFVQWLVARVPEVPQKLDFSDVKDVKFVAHRYI